MKPIKSKKGWYGTISPLDGKVHFFCALVPLWQNHPQDKIFFANYLNPFHKSRNIAG
jgi:hypothetical protein